MFRRILHLIQADEAIPRISGICQRRRVFRIFYPHAPFPFLVHPLELVHDLHPEIDTLPEPELVEEGENLHFGTTLDNLNTCDVRVPVLEGGDQFAAAGYVEACCDTGGATRAVSEVLMKNGSRMVAHTYRK